MAEKLLNFCSLGFVKEVHEKRELDAIYLLDYCNNNSLQNQYVSRILVIPETIYQIGIPRSILNYFFSKLNPNIPKISST